MSNSATPWTVAHQAPLSMNFPGENTGVGSYSFLQGIFPTQGSNPGLLLCRQIVYYLSHQENIFNLVSNMVKSGRYNTHKQKFFGFSMNFKSEKTPQTKRFEN